MQAKMVECSDHDVVYGILTVYDISIEEVQNKIYEIKTKFHEDGFDDWGIDDVFEKFPEEWEWEYNCEIDDIIEI